MSKSSVAISENNIFLFTEVCIFFFFLPNSVFFLCVFFLNKKFTCIFLFQDGKFQFTAPKPKFVNELSKESGVKEGAAVSPMPGVVDKVFVNVGDKVAAGDPLLVIIAMKMEVSLVGKFVRCHQHLKCTLKDIFVYHSMSSRLPKMAKSRRYFTIQDRMFAKTHHWSNLLEMNEVQVSY